MKRSYRLRAVLLLVVLMFSEGCRPLYIARVGIEHLRYLARARPISEEVAGTNDPVRRRRLELVLAAREFATDAGLDVGGSYREIADTSGLAAAWVVTAAYQDRLEPYVWRYPVVGRIPYRGYFDRNAAERFAGELAEDGYDTFVFEAAGYSTLGWLDDPLPSSLLQLDDASLVEVVIHEIVHQTVFVKGQMDFNETLASVIAKRLTGQFFAGRGDEDLAAEVADARAAWLAGSAVFDQVAERLQVWFEQASAFERERMLAGRERIYRVLSERLHTFGESDQDPTTATGSGFNNAVFLARYRYRKHANAIDQYIARFARITAAIADLRAHEDQLGADPYAVVVRGASEAACCSRRTSMSFLMAEQRRLRNALAAAWSK